MKTIYLPITLTAALALAACQKEDLFSAFPTTLTADTQATYFEALGQTQVIRVYYNVDSTHEALIVRVNGQEAIGKKRRGLGAYQENVGLAGGRTYTVQLYDGEVPISPIRSVFVPAF